MLTEVYILYFIVQFSIKKKYVNKSVNIEPIKNAIENRRGKFKDFGLKISKQNAKR